MFFLSNQGRVFSCFRVPPWGVAHDPFLCIWLQSCLRKGITWPGAKCVSIVQVCIGLVKIHVWISVSRGVCLQEIWLGVDRTRLFGFQCAPIHLSRGPGGCTSWWFFLVWWPMVGAFICIYRGVCRDINTLYQCQGIFLAVSILPSWRVFSTWRVRLWAYFYSRGSWFCHPQRWVLCDTGRPFAVKSWRKYGRTWLCIHGGFCCAVQSRLYLCR